MTKTLSEELTISLKRAHLQGQLDVPVGANGLVLFADGSGSTRFSPRNRFVAEYFQKYHLATLLIDLLTKEEEEVDEETQEFRFSIDLLSQRLLEITDWIGKQPKLNGLRLGYFGASTGSAAALRAAATTKKEIPAVVSRGGRPDLAEEFLSKVKAPTLLIVGENDPEVIHLNESALQQLQCPKKLEIVKSASHLFEESGCLEEVAKLALDWFAYYMGSVK